jgi:predicted transcriptional regulator
MAWKGTRPEHVRTRDQLVYDYLAEHGSSSRNTVADELGLSRSLTYLSLDRLRKGGQVKRCMAEDSNDLLWTAAVSEPCP